MSVNTAKTRFIVSSFKRHAGFYQRLLGSMTGFQDLGNRLARFAREAQTFRQYESVNEAGQILINLPLKEYQAIGSYYLGWVQTVKGVSDRRMLEQAAEYAPAIYRGLAMNSLAALEARKQDYASELRWFLESLKVHPSAEALRSIAVVKAKEGYHRAAIKDLENLLPLARYSEPLIYFDCLNSLAVELGEAGRLYDARSISRVVLASPFAYAYPEWQATANDLRGSKRSFVAFNPSPYTRHNVLLMPAREHEVETKRESRPARVLNLQNWKKKMGKEPNGKDDLDLNNMTDRDMLFKIIELSSQEDITDDQLRRILQAVLKITSNRP